MPAKPAAPLETIAGFRFSQRVPRLAAQYPHRRQPLYAGPLQGAETHIRQGGAPQAARHAGRRPQAGVPGDAAGVQRSAGGNPAVARVLHEPRQGGQGRPGDRPGQRHEAARLAAVSGPESRAGSEADRGVRPADRRQFHRQHAVQGQRAELRPRVRVVRPGAWQERAEDELAAGGDCNAADGAGEKTVGRGRCGGSARGIDVTSRMSRRGATST